MARPVGDPEKVDGHLLHFKRLNHRMHNKLFIADGSVAVVGGRNLADEYFLRGQQANFIDFDLLAVGALVRVLERLVRPLLEQRAGLPVRDACAASQSARLHAGSAARRVRAPHRGRAADQPPPGATCSGAPPRASALAQRRRRGLVRAEPRVSPTRR